MQRAESDRTGPNSGAVFGRLEGLCSRTDASAAPLQRLHCAAANAVAGIEHRGAKVAK